MSNMFQNETPAQYVLRMLNDDMPKEQIEQSLIEKGYDWSFVMELVAQTASLRYAQRRSKGLVMILAGAFICLLSFLLTVTDAVSGNTYFTVLFGLTSLGVVVVFVGLMYVF